MQVLVVFIHLIIPVCPGDQELGDTILTKVTKIMKSLKFHKPYEENRMLR